MNDIERVIEETPTESTSPLVNFGDNNRQL